MVPLFSLDKKMVSLGSGPCVVPAEDGAVTPVFPKARFVGRKWHTGFMRTFSDHDAAIDARCVELGLSRQQARALAGAVVRTYPYTWKLMAEAPNRRHARQLCAKMSGKMSAGIDFIVNVTCIEGIDLFCGAGGLSCGLAAQGVRMVAGIDVDPACQYPYEANHEGVKFLLRDITTVSGEELNALWAPGVVRLLAGCAPCQPFSSYANTATVDKAKWRLLLEFARLVGESRPDLVTMENVPRLQQAKPFKDFLRALKRGGYHVAYAVVNSADYGAPQQRKRLVLMASRLGPVDIPEPTHKGSENWVTVRKAVGHLKKLKDGQSCKSDPLHIASTLSELNRARIRASKPGGTWRDWPDHLVAACHQRESGKHSAGVYGRMEWDKPAPTMTTLCNGYGNGRFGHPEQHRGISLREAAIFQSFPETYRFTREDEKVVVKTVGRLIGNAVPPKLGEAVARALYASLPAAADNGAATDGCAK